MDTSKHGFDRPYHPIMRWAIVLFLAMPCAQGATPVTAALVAEGMRYEHGEGVPRDYAQAAASYCRAAKLGDADGHYALGWMAANGRGMARDDALAAQLLTLAAAQGHAGAQALLPRLPAPPALTSEQATAALPPCLRPDPPPIVIAPPPEEPPPAYPLASRQLRELVERLAPQFAIDPQLAMAIIAVESGFNRYAVSPRNAQGLMQLIPETAQRFRVKDAFDAEQNVRGGLAYLRWLLAFFRGDVQLVAAAYNAGERAVERHSGVPPYAETRDYVKKVASLYKKARHPYHRSLLPVTSLIPIEELPHK